MESKKLGKWLKEPIDGDRWMYYTACSLCGRRADSRYPYCPWCGKPMRAGELWYEGKLEKE